MRNLLCNLKADYLKSKHTPLRMTHLVIPCAMAAVFLIYYAFTPWNAFSKVEAYFQIMGLGYPFLIGIFCAIAAEQESCAGSCQMMLAVIDRRSVFLSKLMMLILFGAGSVVLTSVLFGTGYYFILKQHVVRYSFYWIAAFIMAGGSIFLYIWHMFLALRFNKGASVGLGIAESLVSAVCLTGLGDSVWIFLPSAWASRMVCALLPAYGGGKLPVIDDRRGIWICMVVTVAAFVLYVVWGCRWDGTNGND